MGGRTIRIFLPDGTAAGIQHAEIVNRSVQAIRFSATLLPELAQWAETNRTGIYLLFGEDEQSGVPVTYIGEAENVVRRLRDHVREKDFWSEGIVVTNKDENLTKGHVRYLESRLIELATHAARYRVENLTAPPASPLPRSDREAMDELVLDIDLLCSVLGHKVLNPLRRARPTIDTSVESFALPATSALPSMPAVLVGRGNSASALSQADDSPAELVLRAGGANAAGLLTNEGLVVLAGSLVAVDEQTSCPAPVRERRSQLRLSHDLVLTDDGRNLRLLRDTLFNTPSPAGAFVTGRSTNGRNDWKLKTNPALSLNDLLSEQLKPR